MNRTFEISMLEIEGRSAISWLFCVVTAFVMHMVITVASAWIFVGVLLWWGGTAEEVADLVKLPSWWIWMLFGHGLSIVAAASFLGRKRIVKYNLLIALFFFLPTIYQILFPNPGDWDLVNHPQTIRFVYLITGMLVFYLVSRSFGDGNTTNLAAE